MKAVSLAISSDKGICQNPLFVSSVEKILDLSNLDRVSSTVGSGKFSRMTWAFSRFRSTQMRTDLFGWRTGTIGAHQSVGSVTGLMMPLSCMRWSSSFTFWSISSGTRRAVAQLYGLVSSAKVMWAGSPSMHPMVGVVCEHSEMRCTIPMAVEASRLRRLDSPLCARTGMWISVPLCPATAVNCPVVARGLPSAPLMVVVLACRGGAFTRLEYVSWVMTVVSAPVSILNSTGSSQKSTVTVHGGVLATVVVAGPMKRSVWEDRGWALTLLTPEDFGCLHALAKCPSRLHAEQVFSLAGQSPRKFL